MCISSEVLFSCVNNSVMMGVSDNTRTIGLVAVFDIKADLNLKAVRTILLNCARALGVPGSNLLP